MNLQTMIIIERLQFVIYKIFIKNWSSCCYIDNYNNIYRLKGNWNNNYKIMSDKLFKNSKHVLYYW